MFFCVSTYDHQTSERQEGQNSNLIIFNANLTILFGFISDIYNFESLHSNFEGWHPRGSDESHITHEGRRYVIVYQFRAVGMSKILVET